MCTAVTQSATSAAVANESSESQISAFAEVQRLIHEADSLAKANQLNTAIVLGNMALEKARKEFGESDTTVATALSILGKCFHDQVQYARCESLWSRALAIREEKLNPADPRIASSLHYLGLVYYRQGRYDEAEPLYRRALAIRERTLGSEHLDVAKTLNNLGNLYSDQGNYGEAEPYYRRSLSIREKVLGSDHPDVALALSNLATLCRDLGNFRDAELLNKRAIAIKEKVPGSEDSLLAWCLNNLASIYMEQGKYGEVEPLLARALRIKVKILGSEHPDVAACLSNLASLNKEQGKYNEVESLYKQALAIHEKTLGPEHPDVAITLDNLAEFYRLEARYGEVEPLLKRALDILEKAVGPDHPGVAWSLNSLANLYKDQGRYREAEQLYTQALEIRKKTLGPEHPEISDSLQKLAILFEIQGKSLEAEILFRQALEKREKAFGPRAPEVTDDLNHLAKIYCSMGRFDQALVHYGKFQASRVDFINYLFSYTSEEQKMRYLEKYPLIDQSLLSFLILHPSIQSKRTGLDMILRGKAAIIHAVAAENEIAFCSYDEEIRKKVERHTEVCGDIATLTLSGAEHVDPQIYRERLETLYSTKDSLETELSTICSEFEEEMAARRFGIDDIVEALPPGSVLWEFVHYEPYDFEKVGSEKERTGPPRYLAFTLDHTGTIDLTNLGDAGEIDSLVALARNRIYKARGEVFSPLVAESERSLAGVTGEIYERIFAPLETSIGESGYIFISPDGELNLLPFEILPCPDGQFVVEKFNVSYLSSGRELLSFKKVQEPSHWALLMADPDFDLSDEALAKRRDKTVTQPEVLSMHFEASRGASACLESTFDPLPYSHKEIESVGRTLRKKDRLRVESYDGGDALEEIVKGIETPPRIFHLATHGYFCENVGKEKMLENPLLRSGLALAGANRSRERGTEETVQGEDGILTAFEVSGLNLVGTELATLSACETGVGEVRNGEGVYGLRRAFQHAGAQAILMSLWKMPDREIYGLMDSFYKNWSEGQTKQEALRQSTLKMIHDLRDKYGTAHPLLWGGFVLAGNPN
jgi:CHAT domain-containing protein/tetratricopeptide (TPR) repeat protein